MKVTHKKRCCVCRQWFSPNPRTALFQKTCSNQTCQKERKSIANKNWRQKNLDYDRSRRHKTRVWAKNYPDYWCRYRASHPDYVARDNRRRRTSKKKATLSAKQDTISQIAVEKLQSILDSPDPFPAKQDTILRRLNEVVAYLLWKERSAKQISIAPKWVST
jgi:hypothetical protein